MATDEPIRAAVIGAGYLGRFHAQKWAALPGCRLVAIADPDAARRAAIASELGTEAVGDWRGLIGRVDAVSIATPTPLHHSIARACLDAGIHVLVEKPVTASVEEARDLMRAAAASGRVLQVGHLERFNAAVQAIAGIVTQPRFIESHRLAPFRQRGTDVSVVLDLMIHDIGIVLALVGAPIKKIDSVGISVLSKTEDIANARIEFENGCVANLTASRMSLKKNREIRVFQDNAYLSLDFMNQKGHLVKKSDIIAYGLKLKVGLAKAGEDKVPVHEIPIEKGEPLAIELAHFIESVTAATQPKVGGALGKSALEVAITITEEIRRKQK